MGPKTKKQQPTAAEAPREEDASPPVPADETGVDAGAGKAKATGEGAGAGKAKAKAGAGAGKGKAKATEAGADAGADAGAGAGNGKGAGAGKGAGKGAGEGAGAGKGKGAGAGAGKGKGKATGTGSGKGKATGTGTGKGKGRDEGSDVDDQDSQDKDDDDEVRKLACPATARSTYFSGPLCPSEGTGEDHAQGGTGAGDSSPVATVRQGCGSSPGRHARAGRSRTCPPRFRPSQHRIRRAAAAAVRCLQLAQVYSVGCPCPP